MSIAWIVFSWYCVAFFGFGVLGCLCLWTAQGDWKRFGFYAASLLTLVILSLVDIAAYVILVCWADETWHPRGWVGTLGVAFALVLLLMAVSYHAKLHTRWFEALEKRLGLEPPKEDACSLSIG